MINFKKHFYVRVYMFMCVGFMSLGTLSIFFSKVSPLRGAQQTPGIPAPASLVLGLRALYQ